MTTAYDASSARIAAPVVDVILVGGSVGNVCLGFSHTCYGIVPDASYVELAEKINHHTSGKFAKKKHL